ncbi:MAG: HAMP domain-containing protein [Phycisphaeraceae bacterium]|nr:HAMP domain-containing protein [Phycisphaeraceae bacterium]
MALQIVAAAAGLILVGVVGMTGLGRLNARLAAALTEYQQLRNGYELGVRLMQVHEELRTDHTPRQRRRAWEQLAVMAASLESPDQPGNKLLETKLDPTFTQALREALQRAMRVLERDPTDTDEPALNTIMRAIQVISGASQTARARIVAIEERARADQRQAIALVAAAAIVVLAVIVMLGLWHVRSVMKPLRQLAEGTRRLARGRWSEPVTPVGDREFAALAGDFNQMAGQLKAVYDDLEEKVRQRSVQLARSDRLASVGLLAAGVAHEVNNPLGIILGQAELALRQDSASPLPPTAAARLRAICEEAVRCKGITGKLVSLAAPAASQRQTVDLASLTREVVNLLAGEADRRNCRLKLTCTPASPVRVVGDPTELKQVLVNLLLNALTAVAGLDGRAGEVEVDVGLVDGQSQVQVRDNGVGMDSTTLDRVFEPFFTTKRGASPAGTGLGLSVSLAIAEAHGGQLVAASAGVNHGSCLTLRLPPEVPSLPEARPMLHD